MSAAAAPEYSSFFAVMGASAAMVFSGEAPAPRAREGEGGAPASAWEGRLRR